MATGKKTDDRALLLDLGSTTWSVLITLMGIKSYIGPRELARRMGLSSPSVAMYHLDKLTDRGFLEKNPHGEYRVDPHANLGYLDNFLFLRERVVPRTLFYAVMFTSVFVFYLATVGLSYDINNVFTLVLGILGCSFLWAEVYRIWSGML